MSAKPLTLIDECKIRDILPSDDPDEPWEASGVLARDGDYYVVFDDRETIAVIAADLRPRSTNGLFGMARGKLGYEGIAHNARNGRYYLLVESRKDKRGRYRPEIVEYDDQFEYVKRRPMDFEFESDNRGFEAVAYVRRRGQDHVLALCEGNKCKCGRAGRMPGGGRIQVFAKDKKEWSHISTIKLPAEVMFADYSAMSIVAGRVAIVSQENSMLWVGDFQESEWDWRDGGQLFEFPRCENGEILYGNVEGVAWIGRSRVVAVSDKRKKDQPDRCAEKDQSIHIFELDMPHDEA